MDYQKIYDSLIHKRKFVDIIPQNLSGHNHHIVPKCLGGKETVRLTVREHIFAHELLVMIYKDKPSHRTTYNRMLTSIVFLYKSRCMRNDMKLVRFFRSKMVESWVTESYRMRKTRTKIKNARIGKTIWWDSATPIPQDMVEQGWEYGQYLTNEQAERKKA